jgi:hypothetical protein
MQRRTNWQKEEMLLAWNRELLEKCQKETFVPSARIERAILSFRNTSDTLYH